MPHSSSMMFDVIANHFAQTSDFLLTEVRFASHVGRLAYVQSVTDSQSVNQMLIQPFYERSQPQELQPFLDYIRTLPGYSVVQQSTVTQVVEQMVRGFVVLELGQTLHLLQFKSSLAQQSLSDVDSENVVEGAKKAFSEDLQTNLTLIRTRYPSPELMIHVTEVGTKSHTALAIVYDRQLVKPELLQTVQQALQSIQAEMIQSSNELHLHMNQNKRSILPTMLVTQRPDRTALNLANGKVVLVLHGTPFVLLAPTIFHDFMCTMEDIHHSWWVQQFLISLRYFGLFINLTLSSFYVAITSFNPEILRVQLTLSIARSRASVPYPSYIEVLFMLVMMELLTEASIRLPRSIGSTATTVGGLILGQAATQAGLVSNIMIIIVSAVAISNFVIPINTLGFSMRILKYLFLLASIIAGLLGIMICLTTLIVYMASLRSYGHPYAQFFPPKLSKKTLQHKPDPIRSNSGRS